MCPYGLWFVPFLGFQIQRLNILIVDLTSSSRLIGTLTLANPALVLSSLFSSTRILHLSLFLKCVRINLSYYYTRNLGILSHAISLSMEALRGSRFGCRSRTVKIWSGTSRGHYNPHHKDTKQGSTRSTNRQGQHPSWDSIDLLILDTKNLYPVFDYEGWFLRFSFSFHMARR